MGDIVIASRNRGKIEEIRHVLAMDGLNMRDLVQLRHGTDIEESGTSFEENALIKARSVFSAYGIPVIADDSGLVVPGLGGLPGVRSARFAGPGATDERNNELLLKELRGLSRNEREAHFVCVAVFFLSPGEWYTAEGRVDGRITARPAGTGGFGYDPLFYLPEYGKTMAQISPEEKNAISHRGRAFRIIRTYVERYVD